MTTTYTLFGILSSKFLAKIFQSITLVKILAVLVNASRRPKVIIRIVNSNASGFPIITSDATIPNIIVTDNLCII